MRGSPEPLISVTRQNSFKKRFPHRFSPSSRNIRGCTRHSTFGSLCENLPQPDVYQSFTTVIPILHIPTLALSGLRFPIQSDRSISCSDIRTRQTEEMHFRRSCDKTEALIRGGLLASQTSGHFRTSKRLRRSTS